MSRELRGRGEDGQVRVQRLPVEAGNCGQQATHERVVLLVTRLSLNGKLSSSIHIDVSNLSGHHGEVPLELGALLLELDILGPEQRQVGTELLCLARHDCDLFSGLCDQCYFIIFI